jgi:hypothetical protein
MIAFKFENKRLILNAKTLVVPQFNAIWEYYEDNADAIKLLTYIYGMGDITVNNPYLDVPHYEKVEIVKRGVFGKEGYKFSPDEKKLINAALPVYAELNKDSVYRMLEVINFKIDELSHHLRTNKLDKDNIDNQIGQVNKFQALLKSKAVTEEYVSKELAKDKTQGDMSRSPLETGAIKYTPSDNIEILDGPA